ncbi:MAG TPA: hypothetical protein VIO57_03070 [Chloroflexota bacterium]|jgi:hypothetical protein
MKSEDSSTTPEPNFTETQSELLAALRGRYQEDHDLFSGDELSRLRFMRWLQEKHLVAEDAGERRCSEPPLQPNGRPLGPDAGDTAWCVS